MKQVLVPLAEGFEEIEAVTIIDTLRRGGIQVTVAALDTLTVTGSHAIVVQADALLTDVHQRHFDAVVLPGGIPGAIHLKESAHVIDLVRRMNRNQQWVCAICAAPTVLEEAGVSKGRRATSHPSFQNQMTSARYQEDPVVVDGNVITSRGPGTALSFSLEVVRQLTNESVSSELAAAMLHR